MHPVLAPVEKPVEQELAPWTGEPTNITQLQDRYLVEAKITGRLAGTTLFVVMAKDRSGKTDTCKMIVCFQRHNILGFCKHVQTQDSIQSFSHNMMCSLNIEHIF